MIKLVGGCFLKWIKHLFTVEISIHFENNFQIHNWHLNDATAWVSRTIATSSTHSNLQTPTYVSVEKLLQRVNQQPYESL